MWLEGRLGVIGRGRQAVLAAIDAVVERRHCGPRVISEADVDAMVAGAPADIDVHFPGRGDPERVRRIVRHGAMLGVIAVGQASPQRLDVAFDAAMFNLAVALFDSAVDEDARRARIVSSLVDPDDLGDFLRHGISLPRSVEPWANCVVEAFELALAGAHRRRLPWTDEMMRMLFEMHASETGRVGRLAAKLLPTRFIGLLGERTPELDALFASLATFVALWDDWQDLADDIIAGRPNFFIGDSRPKRLAMTALRLAAGSLGHLEVRGRLARIVRRVMHDADAARRRSEVTAFLSELMPSR